MGAMRDGRPPFRWFVVATALGLGLVAAAMWPGLPAIHQDEYLPLFPLTWFAKEPAAQSSGIYPYLRQLLGWTFPALSYPYLGAVKAYVYLALHLPTTPDAYRLLQTALLGVVLVLAVRLCWRLSRGSAFACAVCLALLLADAGLVTLGILDEGNQIPSLAFGTLLLLALWSVVEAPRWWKVPTVALVAFAGELDRINFLWFVGAGLAGTVAAALVGPLRRSAAGVLAAALGCALGLAASFGILTGYPAMVRAGMAASIPTFDLPALWAHWLELFVQLDPWAAYHRYVDTAGTARPRLYAAYRWTWMAAWVAVAAGLAGGALGRARRRPESARAMLFVAATMTALLFLVVKTKESWSAHHVFLVKPFAYVGAGLLAAALPARRVVAAAVAVLALGSGWVGVQAHRDMRTAPPIFGAYDVGRNQLEAWQAAARTPVADVYALDWGVFYPGVVNSPPNQRWEAPPVDTADALRALDAARAGRDMALLFHTKGALRWLLDSRNARARFGIREERRFDRHPGEPWTLLVLNLPRVDPGAGPAPPLPEGELAVNGDFSDGTFGWRYEEWEKIPNTADLSVERCTPEGGERPCIRLEHRGPADSRVVKDLAIPGGTTVAVTAWARAEGVGPGSKGVHVMLMDAPRMQSADLLATTDWRRLAFAVTNPHPTPRPVRLALRLGTWGHPTTGSARFADVSVRIVPSPPAGTRAFRLP